MAETSPMDSEFQKNEEQSNAQAISKELRSDTSSTGEAADEDPKIVQESVKNEEREYITGFKLGMVVVGVTLVAFLVLLDTSIIVTVSCPKTELSTLLTLPGHSQDNDSISFSGGPGVVW
jgi:multidrug efflux pump subunit AcrB